MRRIMLVLLPLLAACDNPTRPPAVFQVRSDAYSYEAGWHAYAPLVAGTLSFTVAADSSISGNWSIKWLPGADSTAQIGSQVGQGRLTGFVTDSMLVISLNPDSWDNNVYLHAQSATPDRIEGHWDWSGFTGPISRGTFTAGRMSR